MRVLFSSALFVLSAASAAVGQQAAVPTNSQLWHHQMIGLDKALDAGFSGSGLAIGVVDYVVQFDHPEFEGRWLGGIDIFGGPYSVGTNPKEYHGTHVAGIIAGKNVGVAQGASLVGVNILTEPFNDNIVSGYQFGLDSGVLVFNNSWEFSAFDPGIGVKRTITIADTPSNLRETEPGLFAAFDNAAHAGVIQVFATGNSNLSQPSFLAGLPYLFPEAQPLWVAVTSVGPDGARASYANACGVAAQWCLAAPGGDGPLGSDRALWSAWPIDQYESINGTSMAAPNVTGALAVASEIFPRANGQQLVQLILQTATDIGPPDVDPIYGWGLLNIGNLVDSIESSTAATFANASWSRFAAVGHVGYAMRQRLSHLSKYPFVEPPFNNDVATGRIDPAVFEASMDGASLGLVNPVISKVWFAPLYGYATLSSGPTSQGARNQTKGALIGADLLNNGVSLIGIAGGYSNSQLDMAVSADSGRMDAFHVGLYGSIHSDGWFMQGSGQAAFFDQYIIRHEIAGAHGSSSIPVGRSSLGGTVFEGDVRSGYKFEFTEGATLSPYAAINARWQQIDPFRETGAGIFNLDAPSGSQIQLAFGPGLSWSSAPMEMEKATLQIEADIAYSRLSGDLRHKTNVSLLKRDIQGYTAEVGQDVLRVGGQLNLSGKDGKFSSVIGYSGTFQQRAVSHSVSAGLQINF